VFGSGRADGNAFRSDGADRSAFGWSHDPKQKDRRVALARVSKLYDAGATPLTTLPDGTEGLFLIRLAPRLAGGVVERGFVVVFLSELWLRAAATDVDSATLRLTVGGRSTGDREGVSAAFTSAGQRFDVLVPRRSVRGAAAVLPWIILAAGLALAGLAGALAVNAARRARAQGELDRIFTLSRDVIAVADFDGRFTRVNPAAEQVLGYTHQELLTRPYFDFVHPDDRQRTVAEAAAIGEGKPTLSFENRYVRKDGSTRVLEWTATPVVRDRATYAVARDVTERREAETELARLAGEQAALRRVATLVARGVPAAEVFSAVAEEVQTLLDAQATSIGRLERDGTMVIVASNGTASDELPLGSRLRLESNMALARVVRTGRSARVDDYSNAPESVGRLVSDWGSVARWRSRSSSRALSGARSPRERSARSSQPLPSGAWRSSPSSPAPRSPMRRAAPSSPRPGRASSRPLTRLAGRSSATCKTARNSASSTP
jgi:PAS domain S-box-containing protein